MVYEAQRKVIMEIAEKENCVIVGRNADFILKDRKDVLRLNVYQKNIRAIHFYQREGFEIQCEGLDEATGEKDYVMIWQQK